jgi:hypothetical protein
MKMVLMVAISLFTIITNAQNDAKNIFNKLNDDNGGDIKVYQSPQLRLAMEKQFASINNKKGIEGYRIQIYFGNGKNARQKTNEVRVMFISQHKDTKAYIVYDNPYFRVKVGDYRTKSEALHFLTEIKSEYPDAFIVPDIIEYY